MEVQVKKPAIICDLDGTLALLGKRSPYYAGKAHIVDSPNMPVVETVKQFHNAGYQIIFVTGREQKFREQSVAQIETYTKLTADEYILYMREDGDKQKDATFKEFIYRSFIEPNYDVLFALEDRDQMVKAYREVMNVPCFQVAEGNF
jgi:hydroxymethylpyrimidine pyrophosphatase-like HAD family hydrolase